MRVAVFASGNGSNFEAIVNYDYVHLKITALFCDNPNAYCLKRAKKLNIPSLVFNPSNYENKLSYEKAILKQLNYLKIDIIILAGYMRIVGETILAAYPMRILNIHPSLLPAFKGLNAITRAYNYGVKVIGISVHFVSEELDGGKIIAQDCFFIENKSLEEVEEQIHQLEHKLYPHVIKELFDRSIL